MAKALKKSAKRGQTLQERQAAALRSAIARWPKGGLTMAEVDQALAKLKRAKARVSRVG